jgi:hypothetical protein
MSRQTALASRRQPAPVSPQNAKRVGCAKNDAFVFIRKNAARGQRR